MRFSSSVLAAALLVFSSLAPAQTPQPQITADFQNPSLNPSHWVLTLNPDGSGRFRSERNPNPPEAAKLIDAPEVDRPIQLAPAFAAHLFEQARAHALFNQPCESGLKVAFQGWKTLSYSGPEGQGSCRFTYSRDRGIQVLGDSLVAVANSILEGARLENLLQHDRLGLDRELEYLTESAADGRMLQIGSIRGILERLAEDSTVMERVRKRARLLLARAAQ